MDFISKFTGIQPKINLDQEGQATPDQPDPSAGIGNIPDAVENLQAPAFFTEDPVAADPVIPDLKIPTESEKETIRLFETAKKEFLRNLSFYVNSPKDFGSYLQKIY